MTTATLLCPLSDFPYMLPGCFPVALVLVVTGLIPLAALGYRLSYYLRFQRVPFVEAIRLSGQVAGVPPREVVFSRRGQRPARPFLLRRASGPPLPVTPEGASLAGWRSTLREGQAITLLGIAGSVVRDREVLFRQPAADAGVQALQIAPDRLRAVRLLWVAAAIGWVLFAAFLIRSNAEARRSFEAASAWTAAPVDAEPREAEKLAAFLDAEWPATGNRWPFNKEVLGLVTSSAKSPPVALVGRPRVRGPLDAELVRRTVRRHLNEVKYCYVKELQASPALQGQVVLQFTVDREGRVVASGVQSSTLGSEPVESCLAQAVRRWPFPRPRGGSIAIVSYAFQLRHHSLGGVQG